MQSHTGSISFPLDIDTTPQKSMGQAVAGHKAEWYICLSSMQPSDIVMACRCTKNGHKNNSQ